MTKTSSRAKEKVVFHAARSIRDPSQRKTYLDAACAGDRQLRERVDALLTALIDAQDFLESPPLEPQDRLATEPDEAIGTVIGTYKLLERIGEGGFGVVYMVDQLEPIQRRSSRPEWIPSW